MAEEPDRAVGVWWRDLGIFWVINAPKYNCLNPKIWMSAHKVWRAQPAPVRSRIVSTWPNLEAGTPPEKASYDIGYDTPTHMPKDSVSVSVSAVVVNDPVSAKAAQVEGELAIVRDALPWIHPAGLRPLMYRDERVRPLVLAGVTGAEMVDTLRRFSDSVEAGTTQRDLWTATYFFSGHYDRLRNLGASAKRDLEL